MNSNDGLSREVQEALDNEMYCCVDCNVESDSEADFQSNDTSDLVCHDCYQENYTSCYECNETIHNSDAYEFNGDFRCQTCHDDVCMECPECENECHRDDMVWSDRYGDYLCDYCFDEFEENSYPEWEVYSNEYVKTRTTFVNPEADYYRNDTFYMIESKRYVGLELETNFRYDESYGDVSDDLNFHLGMTRNTDNQDDYYRLGRSAVVSDGSVTNSTHRYGAELVMRPRRGDKVIEDADYMCKRLEQEWNAYASFKTGLHLHIDVQDYDWIHCCVLTLFTKLMEPHIYTWLPKSRYYGSGNQRWSRPVTQPVADFKYISGRDQFIEFFYDNGGYTNDKYNDKRYVGLNWHSHFQGNQGLEIRYHSGTLQKEKIKHWTKFWTKVVDKSFEITEQMTKEWNHYDFGSSSMYQSLTMRSSIMTKLAKMSTRYNSSFSLCDEGQFTEVYDYRKNSELLRRYLGLPKKDRPYLLQPMLYYLRNRMNRSVMSIENIFDVFEIDKETQDFYKGRTEQLRLSMEEHVATKFYNDVFANVDTIVEFDKNTCRFEYKDIFKDTFLLVNDDRRDDFTSDYSAKQQVDYDLLRDYML